ncbi:polysaccharide biosynthesis/export family protein [Granulicella cerasi]|uniref:Polysaccharide biosynthesis/export family protein n=1 Tax=Granulicella cerasi TaxID=741063 RepID=A0ABW1ZA73_9BACT|nr:polysaccharide biosynthesis/export family protein [Granulicella cerasi]
MGTVVLGGALYAQQPQPSDPAPATPAPASLSDILQYEAPANQPYRLGRGDVLNVLVEGRPELTGHQTVGPDGSISMPLIGSVQVVDMTRDDAAHAIHDALLKYYTFPIVTVTVDGYNSNRVLLLGSISSPGMQTFDHTPTLLEVLAHGGGVTHSGLNSRSGGGGNGGGGGYGGGSGGGDSDPMPDRAVIYRHNQTAITLEVRKLVASGSPLANIRLQRDDIVFVPAPNDRYVSVLGQVQRPGSQMLDPHTTLARLLSDAGGLMPTAGKNPSIRIISAASGKQREIPFNNLLNPRTSEVKLEAGDVIFVPESGFNSVAYVLEKLSPLISIFSTAALLNQR